MDEELRRQIWAFMDENRARSLWWMRPDYYPQTREDALSVLDAISRHCRRDEWIKSRQLARRLS